MLEEVNMVDTRIIRPATEAKEFIQPLKKVIKKREDRKVCQGLPATIDDLRKALQLDFERYNSKVDSGRKKAKRSDKENATLAKNEQDLAQAKSVSRLHDLTHDYPLSQTTEHCRGRIQYSMMAP